MLQQSESLADLHRKHKKHSQEHIFQHWESLSESEQNTLLFDLKDVSPNVIFKMFREALQTEKEIAGQITPFLDVVDSFSGQEKKQWYEIGIEAYRKGEVGLCVMAGGMGTRLGFDKPKGLYDIGMPSGKSLFQMQAQKIRQLQRLAGNALVPWLIMTSEQNDSTTREYFRENKYFGLREDQIYFFVQGTMPCLTNEGGVILESRCKLARSPDGNGGIFPALERSGALAFLKARGVKHLHVFLVDNPLSLPGDPVFVGYTIASKADVANKTVPKRSPDEPVGVMGRKDDVPCVVEYSEIPKEMAHALSKEGKLLFGSGNTGNHIFSVDFLAEKAAPANQRWHIARKKIPFFDSLTQKTVKPEKPNGLKLESFVFDVFAMAENLRVLQVSREAEFAPIKNPPSGATDSPLTARNMLSDLYRTYLKNAGATIVGDGLVEISPLVSYGGEGLIELVRGKEFHTPVHIKADEEM